MNMSETLIQPEVIEVPAYETVRADTKSAAIEVLSSAGDVEVIEALRGNQGEVLSIIQRLAASAGLSLMLKNPIQEAPQEGVVPLEGILVEKQAGEEAEGDPRLAALVSQFEALPDLTRTIQGKVRTGAEIARAISNVEAFLFEVADLKSGEFWEFNPEGQLVMGDGCAEPPNETLNLDYHQARTAATRVTYLDGDGNVQIIEGDDFTEESDGSIVLPKNCGTIAARAILFQRGLPTLQWTGFQHVGEYARKNEGQFEVRNYVWTENGKNPLFARYAYWRAGKVNSPERNANGQDNYRGFRRVLRVKLNFGA